MFLDNEWGSGPPKPMCEVLCRGLHFGGDNSVINNPLGPPGSTLPYQCLPPVWGSAGGDFCSQFSSNDNGIRE
jgi:hypothetical protein